MAGDFQAFSRDALSEPSSDIFRAEALEYHRSTQDASEGELFEISQRPLRVTYRVILATVVAFIIFSIVGHVNEYASGPALVRINGQTTLTAKNAGTLSAVEVIPGQHVNEGDVLVRFDTASATSDLARIDKEIELQTLKLLRDPGDQEARHALAPLKASLELARSHVEEGVVRAPREGVVLDVRVRPWMHLAPGDTVLSLSATHPTFSVIALLPGEYRPLLHAGMPLRFELLGQRYLYQQLSVAAVGNEVVGPNEAKRYLGADLADTLHVDGSVVLVHAELPGETFMAEGHTLHYYDGLIGRADARVKSESVLVSLVPWVKALVTHDGR